MGGVSGHSINTGPGMLPWPPHATGSSGGGGMVFCVGVLFYVSKRAKWFRLFSREA